MANMDQIPTAFEFLDNRAYGFKGAKAVWLKEARSGWDGRQAALQVCVFEDGIQRRLSMHFVYGA